MRDKFGSAEGIRRNGCLLCERECLQVQGRRIRSWRWGRVSKVLSKIKSLRQLAFVSSYSPAQPNKSPFMEVLEQIVERSPELEVKALFRALCHETYAKELRRAMNQHLAVRPSLRDQDGMTSSVASSRAFPERAIASHRNRSWILQSRATNRIKFDTYHGSAALPVNRK